MCCQCLRTWLKIKNFGTFFFNHCSGAVCVYVIFGKAKNPTVAIICLWLSSGHNSWNASMTIGVAWLRPELHFPHFQACLAAPQSHGSCLRPCTSVTSILFLLSVCAPKQSCRLIWRVWWMDRPLCSTSRCTCGWRASRYRGALVGFGRNDWKIRYASRNLQWIQTAKKSCSSCFAVVNVAKLLVSSGMDESNKLPLLQPVEHADQQPSGFGKSTFLHQGNEKIPFLARQ